MEDITREVVIQFVKDAAVIIPIAATITYLIVFTACQIDKNLRYKIKIIDNFVRWLYSED